MTEASSAQAMARTSFPSRVAFAPVPAICAAVAAATGAAVLLGWALDIDALTHIVPGFVAMNPVTALCFIFAATSLLFTISKPRAARIFAGLVTAIALAKLVQLLGGLETGIDQILFASQLPREGAVPNRMAPNTAIALFLLGTGLFVSSLGRRHHLASQILASFVAAISLFALIGYVLGISHLYGVGSFIPMALHTALALAALAIGLISVHRRVGLMKLFRDTGPAGTLARRVLPLAILVPVAVGFGRLAGQRAGLYNPEIGITLQVLASVLVTFLLVLGSIATLYRTDRDRRRREISVAQSERQYRLAESVASVGHWRMEVNSKEMFWSDEIYTITGQVPERGVPSQDEILSLYHPDDRELARGHVVKALKTGEGWDYSVRVLHPSGTVRTMRSLGVCERDKAGRVTAIFGVFADVSDLEKARLLAEQANEEKAAFLANMSHEVRTPLNSIIGFTDLLLEDNSLDERQMRQLRLVQNAGCALLTVVNDILDFSKIGAGKIEFRKQPFALETLVDNTVSIVQGIAETKGLVMSVRIMPDVAQFLIGDESRLRQVLLNLLNNAVKFTHHGSILLTVERMARTPEAQRLRFAVTDTGAGVPEDKQHRLFQQFSQADASVSREYGGTGLGLAICKSLIELMGGEIGMTSVVGHGSTFWFEIELPVTDRPVTVVQEPLSSPHRAARILLVEDLPMNQELACAILSRAGHQVDVANNGAEAIDAARDGCYDLILMDIQMPKVDGITAAKAIREMEGAAGAVPIIAMTANVLPEQVREFRRAGMNDHVAKPIKQSDLHNAIARALQGTQGAVPDSGDDADADPDFDPEIFGRISSLFPPERLQTHLASFDEQLSEAFADPINAEQVRTASHKLISQAGMLGFMRLSEMCRTLEEACETGGLIEGPLAQVRLASEKAQVVLARLRAPAKVEG